MEEFAIGADFKCAAAGWNKRERFDVVAEFENFRRQTDGLRRVISNDAILDRNLGFHWTTSFQSEIIARLETVKKCNGGCRAPALAKNPLNASFGIEGQPPFISLTMITEL
jgi:hypothetical protein